MSNHTLRVYHFEPVVRTLGPGMRCGLWVQGCSLGCPGCLVPDSHDATKGKAVAVRELAARILAVEGNTGVTISGGEPFQQPRALLRLLQTLRRARPELSIMLYTGYMRRALERKVLHRRILALADILVAGPFRERLPQPDGWRGSANQEIHFLTDRHAPDSVPSASGELEFVLRPGGGLFMAGVPPRGLWERLMRRMHDVP